MRCITLPQRALATALLCAPFISSSASEISFRRVSIDDKGPRNPWVKILGDFNGDGFPDVAVGGSGGPLVWYAYPKWQKGMVARGGYQAVDGEAADVDGDGDLDIIMGGVFWYENPGPKASLTSKGWAAHQIGRHMAHDVEVGDLDGDGKLDVVTRNQSGFGHQDGNRILVWKQNSPDSWSRREFTCPHGEGLALGDLDRDGDLDLTIGARWYENTGDILSGRWQEHIYTRAWDRGDVKVALGDLNGDGRSDIVLSPAEYKGGSYRLAWYEAPPDPKKEGWAEHVIDGAVETVIHALGVADMNKDGRLDVAAAEMHQGSDPDEVSVYLNAGKGHKWTRRVVGTKGSHNLVLGDIDNDGDVDIVGANHGGGHQPVELWKNLGRPSREPSLPRTSVGSSDWPQFHGPRRDNLSSERGLLRRWPPEGPELLWTARGIGKGYSSVAVASGFIYTTGNVGTDTVITALGLEGKVKWRATNGPACKHPYSGARGTPTVDGERLYHENADGDVSCLDRRTGNSIWSLNILKKFKGRNITWGLAESLLIDGENLICTPGGESAGIVALKKSSGETVWVSEDTGDKPGYCSPIVFEYGGVRQIVTLMAESAVGVDAKTGKFLWKLKHEAYADENIVTPVFHDGHLLICNLSTGARLLKLSVDRGAVSVEQVWQARSMNNQHGGVLLCAGHLYGCGLDRRRGPWVSLEFKTGKLMYIHPGIGRGTLTFADGMLYALNHDRGVALVPAKPDAYEVVSQFTIPEGGEGPSWAHPVVCGGRLYIRHGDFLYCYDVRSNVRKR